MSNFSHLLADTAVRWQPSAIRRLVPYLRQPDIISFAGGWPAANLFPVEKISQITAELLAQEGASVLQYGDTRG
ncbi:MAG: aminotransferase, partial [Anaerolineales bacterium]|nr:aminotransferase [Anaerolineales bacterium]